MNLSYRDLIGRLMAAGGLLLCAAPLAANSVLYVDDDAEPGGDGQSWETAFRFLQDALDAARRLRAGTVEEIHVAQGLYLPDHDENYPEGNSDPWETFALIDGVALMGGYAGIGAEDPDERNIELYETILSGDLLGNDLPDFVNYIDNSFHVVTASGNDDTALLEGFTITAGYAHFEPYGHHQGGGMLVDAASPVVRQCLFVLNYAKEEYATGGGLCNRTGGHPLVEQCMFLENKSASHLGGGGGMASLYSFATVRGCSFKANTAEWEGAGLRVDHGGMVIENCDFEQNELNDPQPGVHSLAGAGIEASSSNLEITGCLFRGNSALDSVAGGISSSGGTTTVTDCVFEQNYACYGASAMAGHAIDLIRCLVIDHPNSAVWNIRSATDCTFIGNTGGSGAAARMTGGAPTFTRCEFFDNVASSKGGAIYADEVMPTFIDCLFVNNEAPEGGAAWVEESIASFTACRFLGNSGFGRGGAVLTRLDAAVSLTNCLFTGNYSDMGGGLYIRYNTTADVVNCSFSGNTSILGGSICVDNYAPAATLQADNCVLWDNGPTEIYVDGDSTATVRYSCVQGGFEGEGNIDADPLFVDPDGPDDIFGTEDDDLRLGPGSPCIDAGDNDAVPPEIDTDLDGNPRFVDDPDTEDTGNGDPPIVDMGAYEYQVESCPADFDGDGDVDTADLLYLLAAWGTPDGDVDGDGDTDTADLLALLAAWGPCS